MGGAVRKAHIFIMNTSYKIVEMWGSLQAHHSVIRGGYACPVIGTTDFGLPRMIVEYEI